MILVSTRWRRRLFFALAGVALASSSIWACTIPVFRYALERWSADDYSVFVFHRGPLSSEDKATVDRLQTAFPINALVKKVDLAAPLDEVMVRFWEAQSASQLPWIVLRYPRSSGIVQDAWSGPLTGTAVKTLLDSPTRKEIAKRILAGESAVWVLLESGLEQQDDTVARLLENQLKKMEETLKVSMPEIDPATGRAILQESSVSFSMVRLSRDDPLEEVFLQILLHSEPDLNTLSKPMAIPVFGRGRALCVLVGEGIHEDNLERACSFLIAWCSCQVKELNPGVDLLMSVNWSRFVESERLLPAEYSESLVEDEGFGSVERNVLIVVLVQIVGTTIVAWVMISRKRRRLKG